MDQETGRGSRRPAPSGFLERAFQLSANGTNVRTEIVAGITTFMTMAYIIVVNPAILSRPAGGAGPPFAATVAATCVAAAIPTLLMGVWANYPLALASGLGLNAALAAAVSVERGITWQAMMGVVFVEGLIVAILVLTKTREWVMNCIPVDLKRAIAVGIGLLITVVGLHHAHWISSTPGESGMPLLVPPIGNFRTEGALLATFGILVSGTLLAKRVRGALLLGIILTTALSYVAGYSKPPERIVALPDFSTIGKLDIVGALQPALIATIFAFLITDFFDTMGTVIGVTEKSGHLRPDGTLPRLNRVLLVDSFGAIWGGFCSASSVTSYIESASGVAEGGRTGLTSVVVAMLFLACVFVSPLASAVPAEATAAALVIVGFFMMSAVREVDMSDPARALPAFFAMVIMPLTMSISRGIGTAFISYALLHFLAGRGREVPPAVWVLAVLFAASFAMEGVS